MDKTTHQIRCERWLKIINECLASGMKKSEWCKANGISDKSFYYWQRILRNEAYIDAVVTKQVPATVPTSVPQEVPFVELKALSFQETATSAFQPTIIIRQGSMSLEISNHASPELLALLGGFMNVK